MIIRQEGKEEWAYTFGDDQQARKERRNGRRQSGLISRQERKGGMGVDNPD
jgi:hypothetical protein